MTRQLFVRPTTCCFVENWSRSTVRRGPELTRGWNVTNMDHLNIGVGEDVQECTGMSERRYIVELEVVC